MNAAWKSGWPFLAAAASGVLLMFCFPPFQQEWLVWTALTPLLCAAWFGSLSPLRRLLAGYLAGLFFFGPTFSWMAPLTFPGWLVLTLFLSIYPASWTWLAGFPACRLRFAPLLPASQDRLAIWRRSVASLAVAFTLAAAWAWLEWLRGWLFTGFGWNGLGVALHANLPFVQLTAFGGVPLLSALIVFGNVITVATIGRLISEARRLTFASRLDFTLGLAVILAAFGCGLRLSFREKSSRMIKVSLVQGAANDAPSALRGYLQLTALALIQKPDLIVWPENATGDALLQSLDRYRATAAGLGLSPEQAENWLILGSEEDAVGGSYNSAFAIAPQLSGLQTYRKRHLLPFYEAGWPGWREARFSPDGFSVGESARPFWLIGTDARPGMLICVEDTIPSLARENARAGANLLLNLTNDHLLRSRAAERQHFQNALFRSAETGLPLLRCAQTGITAIIDPAGRVQQILPPGTPGILTGEIAFEVHPRPTWYVRHGEWMPVLFGAVVLLRLATFHRRKRSNR